MSNVIELVLAQMKGCGVRFLVTVPDSATRPLQRSWRVDPDIRVVQACHEAEAVAIACGCEIAGQKAVVVMENAGMLHAIDSIRAISIDMRIPTVLMVTYLGRPLPNLSPDDLLSARLAHVGEPATHILQQGRLTEPLLQLLGIPYAVLDKLEGVSLISWAVQKAHEIQGPSAILLDLPLA